MAKRKDNCIPKPDVAYISEQYEQRKADEEAKLRAGIQEMRALVQMDHEVTIPKQYRAITKEVRTPFTRDAWLRVTAALTQNPPVAHVEPVDEKVDAKRSANIAERFEEATRDAMNDALGEDVSYESAKHLVRDRESVIKVVHKPDAWASFPRREAGEDADTYEQRAEGFKKGRGLPLAWRVVDRLSMVFEDGEFGDSWAIEYGEYPKKYLGRRWGMIEDGDGKLKHPDMLLGGTPAPEGMLTTTAGMAVKVEWWEADWWAVVIDGQMAPGFPKPNPYAPLLPYFRAKVADAVLFSLKYLVPRLDEILTMKLNWAYLGSYPNPKLKPVGQQQLGLDLPEGEDEQPTSFQWEPGKMIQVPTGYDFEFVSPPPVGRDLDELIILLRDFINMAGPPNVLRGVAGSDASGYLANQLIAAANLTYKILAKTLQRQHEQAAMFKWHVIKHRIKQPVLVQGTLDETRQWLGLKPDGRATAVLAPIDHLAKLSYEFKPVLPTDEQARAMVAMQLVNSPKQLISKRYALEHYLQVADPESMMDEIVAEDALEQPPLRDIVVKRALEEAGLMPQEPNPAMQLVGPNGLPLLGGAGGGSSMPPSPIAPGQAAAGMPSVPGLNQPMQPAVPQPRRHAGGRPAGTFPGQPSGPRR